MSSKREARRAPATRGRCAMPSTPRAFSPSAVAARTTGRICTAFSAGQSAWRKKPSWLVLGAGIPGYVVHVGPCIRSIPRGTLSVPTPAVIALSLAAPRSAGDRNAAPVERGCSHHRGAEVVRAYWPAHGRRRIVKLRSVLFVLQYRFVTVGNAGMTIRNAVREGSPRLHASSASVSSAHHTIVPLSR